MKEIPRKSPSSFLQLSSFSSSFSNNVREEKERKRLCRKNRWIVLIDDEENLRRSLGQYLFDKGYQQVTACPNIETAFNVCEKGRNNKKPDLIVSDVRMPAGGMDGIDFVSKVRNRSNLQGIPVALLTAKSQTTDRIKGYKAGADAYVLKPFDPEELLSIIDNLIQRFDTITYRNEVERKKTSLVNTMEHDIHEIKSLLMGKSTNDDGLLKRQGWVCSSSVFLTSDERSVLEHVCYGLTNEKIATKMMCSKGRVIALVTILLKKTKLTNRTQLVRWAIATGQVDL